MSSANQDPEQQRLKLSIYVEDALILLAIVCLFVLGIFFRSELWAQVVMIVVLGVMLVVFGRRLTRVHRAFEKEQDQ
ncbi:MAG: hypothetical protein KGZ25_05815 [Planctomycetes bacterium]|nr:hypothetical protein [Planctomycetota bacterium]